MSESPSRPQPSSGMDPDLDPYLWSRCSVLRGIGIGDQDGCQARVFCNLTRPKSQPKSATFGGCDSRNNPMPGRRASRSHLLALDCYATKVFCPPWYWNRGPGWLSSQGVLQSDRPKISAQIGNFWRVRLQKQPDAWLEGVPLPLAFDCYAWTYPSRDAVFDEVGLFPIAHYNRVRRQAVAAYIVNRPIFKQCKDAERRPGSRPQHLFWWEQPIDENLARGEEQSNPVVAKDDFSRVIPNRRRND